MVLLTRDELTGPEGGPRDKRPRLRAKIPTWQQTSGDFVHSFIHSFVHLFIHSFLCHLLNAYHVLSTVLSTGKPVLESSGSGWSPITQIRDCPDTCFSRTPKLRKVFGFVLMVDKIF